MNERRYQRASLAMPVRYHSEGGGQGEGLGVDISLCGLFIERPRPALEAGVLLKVEIEMPDGGAPVRSEGRVVRLANGGTQGVGIELERLEGDGGDRIESFVVHRSRIVRQLKKLLDQPDRSREEIRRLVRESGMDLPLDPEPLGEALERHWRYFRIRSHRNP